MGKDTLALKTEYSLYAEYVLGDRGIEMDTTKMDRIQRDLLNIIFGIMNREEVSANEMDYILSSVQSDVRLEKIKVYAGIVVQANEKICELERMEEGEDDGGHSE